MSSATRRGKRDLHASKAPASDSAAGLRYPGCTRGKHYAGSIKRLLPRAEGTVRKSPVVLYANREETTKLIREVAPVWSRCEPGTHALPEELRGPENAPAQAAV
ncbi:unnamed protein product [Pleuronectes platessa]|uniref:Uncharacterized protein n=1 Tax=Pleuronectes platessa TaxID=8262 RepID=A0A9N7TM31_PLEPL|nr:unnamed protein product [Pleuronectes platessa]